MACDASRRVKISSHRVPYLTLIIAKSVVLSAYFDLRTDSCDERRVYKSEDISGPKGGTYMFNTSPKAQILVYPMMYCKIYPDLTSRKNDFKTYFFTFISSSKIYA